LKPADFQYYRPRQINEALALLNQLGEESKILAGGQSLMPLMNFRLAQPSHLIDINFIEGLDYIRKENGVFRIGCLARQSRVLNDAAVKRDCPLLAEALVHVGYEQTRNRGTFCGSLAHADPAAELPAAVLALDGSVIVGNSTQRREISARDFFQTYLTTALGSDDMVLEAAIPEQPARAGSSFVEFARRFGDFAIVGVAAVIAAFHDEISECRIALAGVGDRPWRERSIEEMLIGKKASPELFSRAAKAVASGISPSSDIHASDAYRRSLAAVLTRRALIHAWERAPK
jgi:CO/xanthine dehydrogenase FAD-binding subunit